MKVRTVMIDNNGTPLVINEADFRWGSDVLWENRLETVDAADIEVAEDEGLGEENDVKVKHKGGGRWVVIVNDRLAHKGTLSKVDAQALAAEY